MHLRNGLFLLLAGTALLAPKVFAAQATPAKPAFDEKAVADFYRGKTVRIIVGFSAGGGYDQYSRIIGRHLSVISPATRTCW